MLCALCDRDGRAINAIAICQRCGAGICRAHLRTLSHPGTPGGMVGWSAPKRECLCHLCLPEMAWKPARQRVASAPVDALPDASLLIQSVEALLREQRCMPGFRPERFWSRRWQALIHQMLPGLAARKLRRVHALDASPERHAE